MMEVTLEQALQLAVKHQQAGRNSAAEVIYRAILAKHLDQPQALYQLAIVLAPVGKYDEGIALLKRAIRVQPTSRQLYITLGNTLQSIGRLEEAADAFREAIRLDPS